MHDFLSTHVFNKPLNKIQNVIEVGAGSKSFCLEFLDRNISHLTLVDKCKPALEQSLTRGYTDSCVEVLVGDILNMDLQKESYDVIVDSHLIHCLQSVDQRKSYLKKVRDSLSLDGQFIIETMVTHDEIDFDFDLYFDYEMSTLYYEDKPIRMIFTAKEVEEELLSHGFKITFFRCFENIKLISHPMREEALVSDPDILRIICVKS